MYESIREILSDDRYSVVESFELPGRRPTLAGRNAAGEALPRQDRGPKDHDETPAVRVTTMYRVKDHEFNAVINAAYQSPEYYAVRFADDGDSGVLVDQLTSERCLLHVAATRARQCLVMRGIG
jgi:superfamily I DNA/RNA helicase